MNMTVRRCLCVAVALGGILVQFGCAPEKLVPTATASPVRTAPLPPSPGTPEAMKAQKNTTEQPAAQQGSERSYPARP